MALIDVGQRACCRPFQGKDANVAPTLDALMPNPLARAARWRAYAAASLAKAEAARDEKTRQVHLDRALFSVCHSLGRVIGGRDAEGSHGRRDSCQSHSLNPWT